MSRSSTLDRKELNPYASKTNALLDDFSSSLFSDKIKLGISCELSAHNSHEIPSFILSEKKEKKKKKRIFFATLKLGALRVKHCKWAFKH